MAPCLSCSHPIEPFISFGRMPIANGFLREAEFSDEFFFDLMVGFCPECLMVQLTQLVEPERLYHQNYAYFSSTSAAMAEHFRGLARYAYAHVREPNDPFFVEIGSNDGILLQNFSQQGLRHLGIEPSENVAQAARAKGVKTKSCFFGVAAATDIVREHGPADVVLGANVISHIPDIHSVLSGVQLLLKEDGVFILEDPYLGDIFEKTAYDQFYDEHVFYFSLASLNNLLARHGMTVVDAVPQGVHGGSMRYVIARKGCRETSAAVEALTALENAQGLCSAATFEALEARVNRSRDQLVALLRKLKQENRRVVGYGATAKSTTLTNYCGIGPELVEFISDTTPIKQGKFSPGTHIPVRPYEEFKADYPDYALLFAWNHAPEIIQKEQSFLKRGGRFITFVPEVQILA